MTAIRRGVESGVQSWLTKQDHGRSLFGSIGFSYEAAEARGVVDVPRVDLEGAEVPHLGLWVAPDKVPARLVDQAVDVGWGLLLVPVGICVALFVYATIFFV